LSHQIKICEFVNSELQFIRDESNFTPDELEFFNLRARGKSIVEISLTMNVSERTASNLSKAVKKKIIKVI